MVWKESVDLFGGSRGIFELSSPNLQVDLILLPESEFTPEKFNAITVLLVEMGEIVADQS
jgi:hypothetical protein